MANGIGDRSRLTLSGKTLGEMLGRFTSVRRPNRWSTASGGADGWYATIANLNSDLDLEIYLDHMISDDELGYWVGFGSTKLEQATKLAETFGLRSVEQFIDDNPVMPKDLSNPVLEGWQDGHGWFGIYFQPGSEVKMSRAMHFICNVLRKTPEFEESVKLDDRNLAVALDLAEIERDPTQDETTKKQLVDARIGQGAYRRELERIWCKKCSVTGVTNGRILRASHVKPWKISNNEERLDPQNGLLLAAHIDALFDAGLITFSSLGEMVISPQISKRDEEVLKLGSPLTKKPSSKLQSYLKHHRSEIFKALPS